jgi:molybdopterin converting factor small subunit
MPTVSIPPPYRGPTRGAAEVDVRGGTVLACLEEIEARYPGFLGQVLGPDRAVHRFVRLFRNGERIEGGVLQERLGAGDTLEIVAAVAGG